MKLNASPIHPLFAAIRDALQERLKDAAIDGEDITMFVRSPQDGEKLSLQQYHEGSYYYARLHVVTTYDLVSDTPLRAVFRQMNAPTDEYVARQNLAKISGPNFRECPTVREALYLRHLQRDDEETKKFVDSYVTSLLHFFQNHKPGEVPEFEQWEHYRTHSQQNQPAQPFGPLYARMAAPRWDASHADPGNRTEVVGASRWVAGAAAVSPQQMFAQNGFSPAIASFMHHGLNIFEPSGLSSVMSISYQNTELANITPLGITPHTAWLQGARPRGWYLQMGVNFNRDGRNFETYDDLLKHLNDELTGFMASQGRPLPGPFQYVPSAWVNYVAQERNPISGFRAAPTARVGVLHAVNFPRALNDFLIVGFGGQELGRMSPEFESQAPSDEEIAAVDNAPVGWLVSLHDNGPDATDLGVTYYHVKTYKEGTDKLDALASQRYAERGIDRAAISSIFDTDPTHWKPWIDLETGMSVVPPALAD